MERIVGPIHGFYLACYTLEDDGRFYGYAKICLNHVTDVWTARAERKMAAGPCVSELDALNAVIERTRAHLREREIAFGQTWNLYGRDIF